MLRRKAVLVLMCVAVIGGCWLAQALSQVRRQEGQPRADRRGRMEEFRQRMQERMREQLGAKEDEWKVLQPRIEKVQQLQRDARGGFGGFGRAGRAGRRGGQAQPAEGAAEREQSDVQKKAEALRNLLDDEASGAPAIKGALNALRKAREKAQQDLEVAR